MRHHQLRLRDQVGGAAEHLRELTTHLVRTIRHADGDVRALPRLEDLAPRWGRGRLTRQSRSRWERVGGRAEVHGLGGEGSHARDVEVEREETIGSSRRRLDPNRSLRHLSRRRDVVVVVGRDAGNHQVVRGGSAGSLFDREHQPGPDAVLEAECAEAEVVLPEWFGSLAGQRAVAAARRAA